MDRLNPGHERVRRVLRWVGVALMVVGGVLVAIGMGSFFLAFGSMEPPRYFWCAFVGMPTGFVGLVLAGYGFLGSIARYSAGEMAPVGKDAFNYVAEGTKDGVKTVAAAIGEGLRAGSPPAGSEEKVRCHKCNRVNDVVAKFCSECGASLGKTKPCPVCHELNDPDAKFCDNCGRPMGQSEP